MSAELKMKKKNVCAYDPGEATTNFWNKSMQ